METLPGDQGWGKPLPAWGKIKAILEELQGFFHLSTGHGHTGTADDGPQIDTEGIADDALSTDAAGRAKIADGYFDETTVDAKFGAGAIDGDRLKAGGVTKGEVGYKSIAVTVTTGQASGSSAADPDLVDGDILGIYSTGNQDQYVDNVVLNGDGSVTVTLAAAATADNAFKVVVLKP